MNTLLRNLSDKFSDNDDFFNLQETLSDTPIVLLGFYSLIDLAVTKLSIQDISMHSKKPKSRWMN
ncbi:hypothetical protein EHS13_15100 [Paenibacillus psychroresistens]|uniref:Uncharacterized protein n=1 Tax=Paenibacillus psychroresistens TaxID=1778678 RepID=A0A6B8RKI9_9BACL|nr:hypothetical protein [Paenibacillus psychroresistens]QGQ96105.1 hypothetical protein EHS13_15100 [Paenibacillus psychroresistens]